MQYNDGFSGSFYQPPNTPQFEHRVPSPDDIEKTEIQRSSNRIGATFLISFGAVQILGLIFSVVLIAIYGMNEAAQMINSPLIQVVLQLVLSVLMFVPPFYFMARISRFRISDLMVHRRIPADDMLWFISFGMMASMGANIVVGFIAEFIDSLGFNQSYTSLEMPETIGGCVLWAVTMSVIPAFVEEFALRVVVLGTLRRFGDTFAIIVSAALFGLMHGNIVQIPFAFILGLIFAYITVVTGSVIPAMLIHFINNFYSCVSEIVNKFGSQTAQVAVNFGLFALFILMGIIGSVKLSKKGYFAVHLYKSGTGLSNTSKLGAFLCTPCMIICVLVYLVEMVIQLIPGGVI